jgi:Domain of unknown function (DUF1929)
MNDSRRRNKGRNIVFTAGMPVALVFGTGIVSASALPQGPGQAMASRDPSVIGAFSKPFEEGGAAQPRCKPKKGNDKKCKPTAVSTVVLKDGRILFWNGIEGSENSTSFVNDSGQETEDSSARVLNLEGDMPRFLRVGDGGATSPQVDKGDDGSNDPDGMAGVPGRPGEGLVGSTLGKYHKGEDSSPPDDSTDNDGDMFCAFQVILPDGRVMVAGGTDWYNEPRVPEKAPGVGGWGVVELEGLRNARTFDPDTNEWHQTDTMKYGRWYPSIVTQAGGKPTIFSGVTKLVKSTQLSQVRRTETFNPNTNEWHENYTGPASETSLPLLPRLHLMPNGKTFYAGNGQTWGPFGQAADEATWAIQKFWNQKTKKWEEVGPAASGVRSGALDVLLPLRPPYNKATVLMAGGVLGPSPGTYATAVPLTEEVTVTEKGKVTTEQTGNLNHLRWFSQGVTLPDGQVLAVNGGSRDEVISPGTEEPVRQAEMYNPKTEKWRPVDMVHRDRTYHNSAVLLPDARVLVGGHHPIPNNYAQHRDVFGNQDPDASFEVYSPPYLFRGHRPNVTWAPEGLPYGQDFNVKLENPDQVGSVVLSRMPATTHVLENDLRSVYLRFDQRGDMLNVNAPPDGVTAPPGYYYLFVNRKTDEGPVPSVARIVRVGMDGGGEAIEPLQNSLPAARAGTASKPGPSPVMTPSE